MAYNKPKVMASASETLELLDSMWVDKKGIMKIAYCCDPIASKHMKKIRDIVEEKGMFLPDKKYVPTAEVINYFNINISQLRKLSKQNKFIRNE